MINNHILKILKEQQNQSSKLYFDALTQDKDSQLTRPTQKISKF